MTWRETSWYSPKRGDTRMAVGHRLSAVRMGMADRTPVPARLVGCRRNDAPPFGAAADHNGFAAQARVLPLLHGCVESVHVRVENVS